MTAAEEYVSGVRDLLSRVQSEQMTQIEKVSERIANSLAEGGVLYVFGSGHGMIFAKESFNRSGGLAPVVPLYDSVLLGTFDGIRKTHYVQGLESYAPAIFASHDPQPGEVMLQFSASGAHPVVVEMCLEAQRRGLYVAAVTNVEFSKEAKAEHSSGKRLYEVADETIDNPGSIGDASISIDGVPSPVGATSTITGIAILHAINVQTTAIMAERGLEPPILYSHTTPGARQHNVETLLKYRDRLRYL